MPPKRPQLFEKAGAVSTDNLFNSVLDMVMVDSDDESGFVGQPATSTVR